MRATKRACLILLLVVSVGAHAQQTFPDRSLRIVAPSAPGATTDIVSRLVANKLADSLGQQVVVDNRPGAGGNLSAELVSRANPDGHTLLLGIPSLATNPSLYSKLPYDPQKDLAPVTLVSSGPLALVVNPSIPATSVKELIAFAKARPGELNFPSVGAGTTSHLAVELFKNMAGLDIVHVPYKSFGQALLDLTGGRTSLMINAIPGLQSSIKTGKLRVLAVTSARRTEALPGVPTVSESGVPGYEVVTWNGLLVPAGTPAPLIARLNEEIAKALKSEDVRGKLLSMGFEAIPGSPQQFAAFIRSETDRWGKIIRATGARVD